MPHAVEQRPHARRRGHPRRVGERELGDAAVESAESPSAATSAGSVSPLYGEPKQHETTASTGRTPAIATMSEIAASLSATVMCTFFSLYTGSAEIVTVSASMPAATAISAPRRLGTSAHHVMSAWRSIAASTASGSAIAGTALGDTKLTASMWRTPVAARASMNRARSAAATGCSDCSPSRGPTSLIVT